MPIDYWFSQLEGQESSLQKQDQVMRSDGVLWETKMVCLLSGSAQEDQEEEICLLQQPS